MLTRCFAKYVDQRFAREQEDEFKKSLQQRFVVPMSISIVVALLNRIGQGEMQEGQQHRAQLYMAVWHYLAIVCIVLSATCLCIRSWTSACQWIDLEIVSLVQGVFSISHLTLRSKWCVSQLYGIDPLEEFGYEVMDSEEKAIVGMFAVTIYCCFLLPIRSYFSWMVPTIGVACFGALTLATSSPFPQTLPGLLPIIVFILGGIWFSGSQQETHHREKWLAQQQVEKEKGFSEKQHQAFSQVLARLCDCLVQLGPSFAITEPCERLSAMLFLDNSRSLQGTNFSSLCATEEDSASFVHAMESGAAADDPTGILPLHLKDRQGNCVQVHIYFSCFRDQNDSPYYVVGIVEARDRELASELASDLRQAPVGRRQADSTILSLSGSDESSCSELSLERPSIPDFGEISVTIDAGLRIVSATPGFTALCGPVTTEPALTDWIPNASRFTSWFQSCVGQFHAIDCYEDLRLRTPSARRAGLEFFSPRVFMQSIAFYAADAEREEGSYRCRLILEDVVQRERSSSVRKRNIAAGGAGRRSEEDTSESVTSI